MQAKKATTKKARELITEAALKRQEAAAAASSSNASPAASDTEEEIEEVTEPSRPSQEEAAALSTEMQSLRGQRAIESPAGVQATVCPSCTAVVDLVDGSSGAVMCGVCSNVVNARKLAPSEVWQCSRDDCEAMREYYNHADCGVCGVCGQKR
jgi:hypothetical protein